MLNNDNYSCCDFPILSILEGFVVMGCLFTLFMYQQKTQCVWTATKGINVGGWMDRSIDREVMNTFLALLPLLLVFFAGPAMP